MQTLITLLNNGLIPSLRYAFDWCLSLAYPKSKTVSEVEAMTPEELKAKTGITGRAPEKTLLGVSPAIAGFTSALLAYHRPEVQTAIWEIKYKKNEKIAALIGTILDEELLKIRSSRNEDLIIIPIPLSEERRKERGYNQIELVLDHVSLEIKTHVRTDLLLKTKDTLPQSHSDGRTERLKNLSGCFSVSWPEDVRGKNIVLIDDVLTTGSTLEEASKTLLASGAKSIYCLALAH